MKKVLQVLVPTALVLLLLTACSKSPEERLRVLFDNAKENWKTWNQQDWVDFYKQREEIFLDFFESDGTAEELEALEQLETDLWDSWSEDDEDFGRMLQGAKEFEQVAEMWFKAEPRSGGEAYLADKEAVAVSDKLEKAYEKWKKAHQEANEGIPEVTMEVSPEDADDATDVDFSDEDIVVEEVISSIE